MSPLSLLSTVSSDMEALRCHFSARTALKWNEVVTSDFDRTKLGPRTKVDRTKVGPRVYTYILSIDYLQNVHSMVQWRQFATRMYSLCVPGLLVAKSISRSTYIHILYIRSAHSRENTQYYVQVYMYVVNYLLPHSCENPDTGRDARLTACIISRG